MDYERIQKPQGVGGGFSPGKLRTMLMGVEKQRKKDDQLESAFTLRSQPLDLDESGSNGCDNIKDVDIVSVLPECSTSTTTNSFESEMIGDRRSKDNNNHSGSIPSSRARNHHQDPLPDYDEQTCPPSSNFEFQKGERIHQKRVTMASFSKPAPSKWDDAQKWIASPTSSRPKSSAPPGQGRRVSRQSSTKFVVEVLPDPNPSSFEEPDTKQIDVSQERVESWAQKLLPWEMDACNPTADLYSKPMLMIESLVGESAINLSRHSSSVAVQSSMTFMPPPSTARSVSMRDMGTEMTPIASQEPSRNGTPVRATTPIRSPSSSRPSTPPRTGSEFSQAIIRIENLEADRGLSEKELQMKTRREIMALGTQLGKTNIAAWASKEEEDNDVSTSFKTLAAERQAKIVIESRATAWEEAEKAKFMARFKREEMKIQAWENHQKAKTEAGMRKIEVEVERMRGQAHDKLMTKLASARHKAEEKRAAAEAKRNQQAAKTEHQAEYIRRTGRVPSLFSCWGCCF